MKYHIKADGTPGICTANKRPCKYGGANAHWDTLAEAQAHADLEHTALFVDRKSLIPHTNNVETQVVNERTFKQEMKLKDKSSINNEGNKYLTREVIDTLNKSGYNKNRRGLKNEVFVNVSYAKKFDLDKAIVISSDGEHMSTINISDETSQESINNHFSSVGKQVYKSLNENGYVTHPNGIIKAMYYSDKSDTTVVEMGSPDMPDSAIVKGNKVELIEIKDLSSSDGAQIDSRTAAVGHDGTTTMETSDLTPKVKENLKYLGYNKTIGTNYSLNSLTYHDSLECFVDIQKKKGISHLAYHGRDDRVHDVSFDSSSYDIATKLQEENVNCTLLMRSNLQVNDVNNEVLEHWKNDRAKQYFKNGNGPKLTRSLYMTLSKDLD